MQKTFNDWLGEGEEIYNGLLGEYREIETQIEELERRLNGKQAEVNQIAAVIGKPPMDNSRRLSAQLVTAEVVDTTAPSANNIARALNGRFGR